MHLHSTIAKLGSFAMASILAFGLSIPTAVADDGLPPELSPEQRAAIKAFTTPQTVSVKANPALVLANAGKSQPIATTKSLPKTKSYTGRLSLYRGSALMWARDTAIWYYTGSRMVSSSVQQQAGYIFPNTAEAKGTSKTYSSSSRHEWESNYTVGAGVVTPWGAARIYSVDSSSHWNLYYNGSGRGWWNN